MRGRKKKLIIIVILTVAITGLSVGLATFSNILTISSSATVKPGDSEYKLTIYGWNVDPSTITDLRSEEELFSKYASTTYSIPAIVGSNITVSPATIDNNNFKIGNILVTFVPTSTTTITQQSVQYLFALKNEGAYDIFFDSMKLKELISTETQKTCTAVDPAKQDIADLYCKNNMHQAVTIGDFYVSETSGLRFYEITAEDIDNGLELTLSPGEKVAIRIVISGYVSDYIAQETGGIYVKFENLLVDFGSTNIYAE